MQVFQQIITISIDRQFFNQYWRSVWHCVKFLLDDISGRVQ